MTVTRVRAQHVVAPDRVVADATVVIEAGRIVAVEPGRASDVGHDGWLVPGFVDTHCHGGAGADFTDPDPAAARRAVAFHRRHGTTTLFASSVTQSPEMMIEQVSRLADLAEERDLAGIHLEGPWLSPARAGAHDVALLRTPDSLVSDALRAGRGYVRMVTLAPELPGAHRAIRALVDAGVVVAFGHSDADVDATRAAVAAGASVATHLFNAMRPIHHRQPGPVPALLTDPRVVCELICDSVHVAPDVAALAVRAAGADRIALITDAMSAAGCPDGDYRLGTLAARVSDGVARILTPSGEAGAIAGSTLTMDRAFAFAVSTLGLPVPVVARMAATTPARAHALPDVGELAPGRRADACLVDGAGRLERVLVGGQWLDEA